jgi:hypothetical protein
MAPKLSYLNILLYLNFLYTGYHGNNVLVQRCINKKVAPPSPLRAHRNGDVQAAVIFSFWEEKYEEGNNEKKGGKFERKRGKRKRKGKIIQKRKKGKKST